MDGWWWWLFVICEVECASLVAVEKLTAHPSGAGCTPPHSSPAPLLASRSVHQAIETRFALDALTPPLPSTHPPHPQRLFRPACLWRLRQSLVLWMPCSHPPYSSSYPTPPSTNAPRPGD